MTIYLATYTWQGSDQWAGYELFRGEYQAVYNRAIAVPSDLDFKDLKPIKDAKSEKLQAMGYEVKVVE